MPKQYCAREGAEFPAEEFSRDENGVMIHRLGKKNHWHYATTGELIEPGSGPGTLDLPGIPLSPETTKEI